MPWRFGWKHEYCDAQAYLTPRHNHVAVRTRVAPRRVVLAPGVALRPVSIDDAEALIESFIDTFEDGVEFCDWEIERTHAHARHNIIDYFAGRRGAPHAASRLAAHTHAQGEADNRVLAAALFTRKPDAPVLDLLMVRLHFRRRGIAGALVGAAMNDFFEQGETLLRSAHEIANEESAGWHRAFGFTEEPDLTLARLRREFYRHEMHRREHVQAEADAYARMKAEYEMWRVRADELEEICDREGYEAVTPLLRLP